MNETLWNTVEANMTTKRILLALLLGHLPISAMALTFSQGPLFIGSTEPRVMLVASKDHQLSVKAYTDYSDLDNDGVLDTTYKDTFSYYGYFDSGKCYSYSNSRFEPSGAVTSGTHQCDGSHWSGNFLNWASMTRMDVLRKAFYGGSRSTDTTTETVLERHFLPVDVHAFAKIYNPGSAATLSLYIPSTVVGANTSISLCNVSDSTDTDLTGTSGFTMPAPLIKVAAGSWPQWDSSEVTQCAVNIGMSTQPTAVLGTYNARVKVCVSTGGTETNCKTYTHPTTGVQTSKPKGLLQQYGDVDAERRVRFGLMTGSYAANKSGGVLRKNIALIANNNGTSITSSSVCGDNNDNDEIDVCTGQFINQAANQAGIINTLNRLRIAGFEYTSGGRNDKHRYSCNTPGLASFTDGQCVDWGNPLSETYLEALRYFAYVGATPAFDVSDASILASIPRVTTWTDPLPNTEWCALSSIVLLSTGLNSFDTDQLASFTPVGGTAIDAATLTETVGNASHEAINGGTYLIGDNGSTGNNQCTAKTVSNLATAKGICPEVPSTQGGYGIAGLAYAPKSMDLRPIYALQREARWGGAAPVNKDWALRQPINTYTVQLAETLPSFNATVGTGTVTILPACQANTAASPGVWTSTSTGWRNCSMTNLIVEPKVASASVGSDHTAKTNTCGGDGTNFQCFTVAWEDSTWGNDYDMDGIQRLGYCVGADCASFKMLCPTTASAYATLGPWAVGTNEVVVATCTAQANAGHALTFGYTITGTSSDSAYFPILRPGSANFNVGSTLAAGITAPSATTFSQGASSASLLKNPLWYAAKYGGFTESTPESGTPTPNLTSEWDKVNNTTSAAGADGIPDNYYDVRNPANLAVAMANIFDSAAQPDSSAASVATNSTNLKIESRVFQAKFSSADWSGQLLSYKINTSGTLSTTAEWDAGAKMNSTTTPSFAPGSRVILTKGDLDGVAFMSGQLTPSQQTALATNIPVGRTYTDVVNYLRGETTIEGTTSTSFRERPTSKLGDIVNSNPWYVGPPSAGFSDVDNPGYSAFRTSKLSRTPVVYVAGNDGMLHGFDASLDFTSDLEGVPTSTSGKELIAYVPTAVFPNLSKLTAQTYNKNHIYFVDGSPMVGDADLDSSVTNDWRTVLVGALGAGGKGYYALDVSNPANFSNTAPAPANTLLWEFDETDMGYAFNFPPANSITNQAKQIVKMANGKWAVILGNGYNSASGKAVLYILFIENGIDGTWGSTDYVKIVADAGPDNGLSTPVPFDSNGDGYADTVYAGDLKGHLWKFLVGPTTSDADVDSTTLTWKVDFSTTTCASASPSTCEPLFTATDSSGNAQPIVWPPEVTTHPKGGLMILFGTGKYLENTDVTSTASQTFYGIWDANNGSAAQLGTRATELLEQTYTESTLAGGSYRIPSTNPITWRTASDDPAADCSPAPACGPTHRGWYMDLATSKERTTGIPKLDNSVIYFNTFIPSTALCDAGGTGWLMSLDYQTGGLVAFQLMDTNDDGIIDSSDTLVGGFQVGAALGGTTLIRGSASSPYGVGVSSLTSGSMGTTLIKFGVGARGRINWREIVQ